MNSHINKFLFGSSWLKEQKGISYSSIVKVEWIIFGLHLKGFLKITSSKSLGNLKNHIFFNKEKPKAFLN